MNYRSQTIGAYLVGGLLFALGAWQVLSTLDRSPYAVYVLAGLIAVGLLLAGLWNLGRP